jgi:2-hydroxychromene-2-carboxylate isomerase
LATSLSAALWSADKSELATLLDEHGKLASDDAQKRLRARRDHFLDEGHYLTGTLHYAGEWYWSIERLDHLAGRLNDMGMGNRIWPLAYGRAKQARLEKVTVPTKTRDLTLYFSFRSPYSYLALARTYALVDHYGLTLHIRPVLPMVMRGLAVPGAKRFYILRDAAREARLHNIPFGKICDPVGIGVERCMAIWPLAEKVGRLPQWLHTAATGIWSKGIDTASDKGLKSLVEKAGLDWNDARLWLNDDSWRQRAEANRVAMMKAGNWGVPSFQLDEDMVWGQDRFAVIEASLFAESR